MAGDNTRKVTVVESLNRLNARLRKIRSTEEAFEALADELKVVTDADFASVIVLEKNSGRLRIVGASGLSEAEARILASIPQNEDFRNRLLSYSENKAARFTSENELPQFARQFWKEMNVTDIILGVITTRQGLQGYMVAGRRAGHEQFPVGTEEIVTSIRNEVSLAIENVRTSRELSETKEWTERVLSLAPIAIISCDRNGILKSVNNEMLRILSVPSGEDLVGTSIFEIPAVTSSGLDNLIIEGMRGHEDERTDIHFVPKPDRTVYLHAKVNPMWRGPGELEGVLCVAMDVTSKIRLQNQLERSYEKLTQTFSELERVNKMKSTFIDVVSHELRTPLTVMRGYIDLLQSELADGHDPKVAARITTIKANTDRLYNLVESMLDVSRLEKGSIEIHPEPVAIDAVLQLVADAKKQMSQEKNQSLSLDIEDKLPIIMADRRRLKDVFENLVDNAVRYTQDGGRIQIGARDEGKLVHVWVKDNGVGIPLENLGRIFERFYIISSHDLSHQVNRLGLGLPLSKGIVEAHNGQIWVESQVGKGSVFHVSLPKVSQK